MGYIKNYDQLASNHNRKVVLDLVETAFASIAPSEVFKNNFILKGEKLTIQDHTYDLSKFERVFVVGFGKGSAGNCKMVEEHLGTRLTDGYVIDVVEDEHFKKLKYTKGTHPLPSQENIAFTSHVIEKLEHVTETDLVIIVTCGGGSVLFEAPNTLSLERITEVNKALLQSGANITEMNAIRKHLSRVKGGGLAKILYPATVVNLIYSDVPGNDLSVIASGPLVKNHSSLKDVEKIMKKYDLEKKAKLKMEDFVETPTDAKFFKKVRNVLMLSNLTALNAMEKKARELGYEVYVMTDRLQGDAKVIGEQLINETPHEHILLAGGESTVKVKGKGVGGRNQALVLSALKHIQGDTVIASFGTDGWDFTTFAGAIGDKDTLKKVTEMDINVEEYIDDDNSTRFYEKEGDGIITGHLDSNVSDLYIVLRK
jgi:glycerate 2-kinase